MAAKTEEELLKRLSEGSPSPSPYKKFYVTNFKNVPGNDYCIMQHSNKVCLVYLAETHSVIQQNKEVKCVEFCCVKESPGDYKVSGKTKSAKKINIGSTLCKVHTVDNIVYSIESCVRGNLVEINEMLTDNPNLIKTKYSSDGYLVIMQPAFKDVACMAETTMDSQEYQQYKEAGHSDKQLQDDN